ncbi:MAG: phospholipid carrier-dependent glycosyltransferase [Anaerolineaceae bacterium]|nr:phospholipid carrier-dependent glycosyltransferase [Anaerolineaceae bacterium]
MPAFLHSRWFPSIERLVALLVLLAIFLTSIGKASYGEDESHWIHTSSYLEILFTHKPDSPLWSEHYWTLTQPPVARYLIGLGRLAGGYGSNDLNTPWQFDQDYQTNIANGNLPGADLLWWSRLPMAILAALAGWVVFLLLLPVAGRTAGYYFLFAFAGSPYVLTHLRRAMSETPLLFFTLLAAIACWKALVELQKAYQKSNVTLKELQKSTLWFILAGACCGLAGASKINGLFSAGGLFALILLAVLLLPGAATFAVRRTFAIRSAILSVFAALLVFTILNPYLYANPLLNTARMFKFRVQEMTLQVAGFPENVLHSPLERIEVISRRIFEDYALPGFPGARWLNLLLTGAGLAILVWNAWRWLRYGEKNPASAALLVLPAPLAAAALITPLDWDRYYLFPVLYAAWCSAAGFGLVMHALRAVFRRRKPPF